MKILAWPRQSGRTSEIIKMCAEEGGYIITRSIEAAYKIREQARIMGLSIPFPLSYKEFVDKKYYPRGVEKFYIDDVEALLSYIAPAVKIEAVTICYDSHEWIERSAERGEGKGKEKEQTPGICCDMPGI